MVTMPQSGRGDSFDKAVDNLIGRMSAGRYSVGNAVPQDEDYFERDTPEGNYLINYSDDGGDQQVAVSVRADGDGWVAEPSR